ncbi:DUF4916 domain-containing protein [Auraticoccus sp. F435]|uniref:DUF4916 domain-containing protein n=1 Tax=Auraticoccus cholistanensis TaxID=2656650 RepID=A0A6A9V0C9_9ACTN|nr:DUF4916 domain-containing protein [Auraticoccus cholistanensis]MVA75200.1 DUF4916 domain-containing protein [Auraticoccus cholistanensis]
MSSLGTPDPHPGWLSEEDLTHVRHRLPLLYVEAIPVRQAEDGTVSEVGMLLRADAGGTFKRTIVSGRVLYAETVRAALLRHLEKDLGPMAFPRLPACPTPFTVAEYFPLPGLGRFSDERQHAVSLVFVVPVTGRCDPRQDALELTWLSPAEAVSAPVTDELEGGRGALIRMAMAHVGALD